jgi:hypothetical protein
MATRKAPVTKSKPKTRTTKAATRRLSWAQLCLVAIVGAFTLVLTAAAVLHTMRDQLSLVGDYTIDTRAAELDVAATSEKGEFVWREASYGEELSSFLATDAEQNLETSDSCAPLRYKVTHATSDGQQLKLSYGCEEPNAFMFLIHNAEGWREISPTNQFDTFGTPRCDHVGAHNISRDIAPVCWNGAADGSDITYVVR